MVELCELGCGVVLTRNELRMHVMDTCVNRVVVCEHCWRDFKFCYLAIHHDDCLQDLNVHRVNYVVS